MSKQVFLQDVVNPHMLPDGTSAYADFIGSRNQRFTASDTATKKHILWNFLSFSVIFRCLKQTHMITSLYLINYSIFVVWIWKYIHPFNGPLSVKPSGFYWSMRQWVVMASCKSAPRSRQITTPAHHHLSFLQAGCPFCRPTNSIKALKAQIRKLLKIFDGNKLFH